MDPRAILDRFRRRSRPTPELTAALADLDRLAGLRPDLAPSGRVLADLLAAAFLVPDGGAPTPEDRDAMAVGWPAGIPAFRSRSPRLDGRALSLRGRALARVLGPTNPGARDFEQALRRGKIDLAAWADEVFAGRPEEVDRRAEAAGVAADLARSVLRLALLPSLAVASKALDEIRPEGTWDRGDCPHCGSRPLLAESRGLEQRIVLRCGLCAADWPGERLRCPSCGESGAKSLHYSYVEGEQERHRLAHCDMCRYDWKVVATLTALSPPGLIVADLATVHLDILAADREATS